LLLRPGESYAKTDLSERKQRNNTMQNTYSLATTHNESGAIVRLDMAPTSLATAKAQRESLLAMKPSATVYVINLESF